MATCKKTIDQIIDKIEKNEKVEEKKEMKRRFREESLVLKMARLNSQKLDGVLQKRKESLKKEIMKKRAFLEKDMAHEIQAELNILKKRRRESGENYDVFPPRKRLKHDGKLFCLCKTPYDSSE